jgi:hypothetical protein
MKRAFFAIAMIFAVALTSCQNNATEVTSTSQDTTQVDSTAKVVDTTGTKVDTACCAE